MNEQLELPLWETLRSAQIMPEAAGLNQLLMQVDRAIADQSEREHLKLAGEALLQVAELCALRAEVLLSQWEEAYRTRSSKQDSSRMWCGRQWQWI